MKRIAAVGLAALGLAALAIAIVRLSSGSIQPVASVNGVEITQRDFDDYAGVFAAPDGTLTVSRETILKSLINQQLVAAEARKRGITAPTVDPESLAEAAGGLGINLRDTPGGEAALKRRMEAFELFKVMRSVVITPVEVTEQEVLTLYSSDPVYEGIELDMELRDAIRGRIAKDRDEQLWEQWLDELRTCANIEVFDRSLQALESTTGSGCEGN